MFVYLILVYFSFHTILFTHFISTNCYSDSFSLKDLDLSSSFFVKPIISTSGYRFIYFFVKLCLCYCFNSTKFCIFVTSYVQVLSKSSLDLAPSLISKNLVVNWSPLLLIFQFQFFVLFCLLYLQLLITFVIIIGIFITPIYFKSAILHYYTLYLTRNWSKWYS